MVSQFTQEQFDLLSEHGGQLAADGTRGPVYRALRDAHYATKNWALELCAQLFPDGKVVARRAPINQAGNFTPYTWAKIYPTKSAPEALAYTVGIDSDGTFVVKIDTVRVSRALKTEYEAIRGPANRGSSIAKVLDAADGLAMDRDVLLAWSAEAIANFNPSYDDLVTMLRLDPPLCLVTDPELAWQWSAEWREVMLDGAISRRGVWWVPEAEIIADNPKSEGNGGYSLSMGVDPRSNARAVSFADSLQPGTRNPLSNFAIDHRGRRFLMHQARLSSAGANIVEDQFLPASGLHPVPVKAQDDDAKRKWLIVADLDAPRPEIRRSTGRFVHACALVRNALAVGEAMASPPLTTDTEMPWYVRVAPDEVGGTYVTGPRGPLEARVVERKHGLVSMRLRERLGDAGIVMRKLQHPLGFEMDGEVLRKGADALLLEIKTSIAASSIHGGIGQLHLYSRLIPGLEKHKLVLLVPKMPAPEVVEAIKDGGIEVYSYCFGDLDTESDVVFSDLFLGLCMTTSGD